MTLTVIPPQTLAPVLPLGCVLLSRLCPGALGLSRGAFPPIRSWEADMSPDTVWLFAPLVPGSLRGREQTVNLPPPRGPLGDVKAVSPLSSCPPASEGIAGRCSVCSWCRGCPSLMGCCLLHPARLACPRDGERVSQSPQSAAPLFGGLGAELVVDPFSLCKEN